ncbi:hypothetical protein [Ktedonobacter robiniae]|uniref:hypothetical protein n=1 Tax=Ktedonobacter robiniae TaxID=2778365 RepID=UPI0019162F4D|nr:hypothetical protein [Ktedonobacter robiniae]
MDTQTQIIEQIAPYQPWLTLCGVLVLFLLLRATRKALRRRVDEIGYWLLGERGRLIWFWINAPGVMLHELSHAAVVLLFTPFGFRITSITLFRVQPTTARDRYGRVVRSGGRQSLQLGEVQYVRPRESLSATWGMDSAALRRSLGAPPCSLSSIGSRPAIISGTFPSTRTRTGSCSAPTGPGGRSSSRPT